MLTAGLDWDEEMSEPLINKAHIWFKELSHSKRFQIPRCLLDEGGTVNTVTLHTFVDASENAYGVVVYTRHSYQDGSFSTYIVAAKTQVSPSKALSITSSQVDGCCLGYATNNTNIKRYEVEHESVDLLVGQFGCALVDSG